MRRVSLLPFLVLCSCVEMMGESTSVDLSDFDFNTDEVDPKTADVTSGPEDVTCTLTASDTDGPGIKEIGCNFVSPSRVHTASCFATIPTTGDDTDGVWHCTGTIPEEVQDGIWLVSEVFARDFLGRRVSLDTAALDTEGFPTELDVTSTEDVTAPDLTAFAIDPVNTPVDSTVECDITADDGAGSGVEYVGCTFALDADPTEQTSCFAASPATTCDAPIAANATEGAWTVISAFARDVVQNRTVLSTAEIEALPATTSLNVGAGGYGGGGGAGGAPFPTWPQGPEDTCTLYAAIGAACICEGSEYTTGYCCTEGYSFSACSSTELYAKPTGTGTEDGSDWDNALDGLPASLIRDRVYWIADGDYGSTLRTFDTALSGSTGITIRKATEAMHGTETGWNPTLGDDPATFGQLQFDTGRFTLDGGETNGLVSAYSGADISDGLIFIDPAATMVVLRHMEMDAGVVVSGSTQTGGICNLVRTEADDTVIDQSELHSAADDGVEVIEADDFKLFRSKIHNLPACGNDSPCTGPCTNGHSDGIELAAGDGAQIVSNMIYDIGPITGCVITREKPIDSVNYVTNMVMRNNICYAPTVGLPMHLPSMTSPRIYNNIIWGRTQGARYGGFSVGGNVTDLEFYNNIVTNIIFNHSSGTGYDSDEHHLDNNQFGVLDPNEYPGSANDQVGDPLFLNIPLSSVAEDHTPADLLLQEFTSTASSPMLDQGATAGPTWDILGVTRPVGTAYDMGPFEIAGVGGSGGTGGTGGTGGAGGAPPLFCASLPVDGSVSDGWLNVFTNDPASNDVSLELYVKAQQPEGIVAIAGQEIQTFGNAAMLARFANTGFVDARDGTNYGCGTGDGDGGNATCVFQWTADTWYRVLITADVSTERYTVQIGQCADPLLPLQTIITDAYFRDDGLSLGSPMTHHAVWSGVDSTTFMSSAVWNAGDCIPLTCSSFECGSDNADSCGGTIPESCGSCGGGEQCNDGLCCTLHTCANQSYECGSPPDNCGGTAADAPCGTCGGGTPNCNPLTYICEAGAKPSASNTGVLPGWTGAGSDPPTTVSVDDSTYTNFDYTGQGIDISADNVTMSNCKFNCTSGAFCIHVESTADNFTMEDCEIITSAGAPGVCFRIDGDGTFSRLYVHDCGSDAFKPAGNSGPIVVEDSFIEKLGLTSSKPDGIQIQTGLANQDVLFQGNTFFMPDVDQPGWPGVPYAANYIFITKDGTLDSTVLDGNWFDGGRWGIDCEHTGLFVTNNKFGRSDKFGIRKGSTCVWTNNTWEDTGLPAP